MPARTLLAASASKCFDADKDGKLKEEEVPEFVRQFIFPADADGDGLVTKEELQASRERQTPRNNP